MVKNSRRTGYRIFFLALAEYFGDTVRQGKIYNDLTSGYLTALSDLVIVNIYDGSRRKNKYKNLIYELDSMLDNGQEYKSIRNSAIHYALLKKGDWLMKYTMNHPGFDYCTELSEEETAVSIFADTMELRLPVGNNRRPVFHFVFNPEQDHTGEYFGAPPDEWYVYTGISLSSKEIWEIKINDELRLNLHHAEVSLHSYLKEKQNNIKHWVVIKLYDNMVKDGDYQVMATTPGVNISADAARGLMIAMTHGTLRIADSNLPDSPITFYPNTNL